MDPLTYDKFALHLVCMRSHTCLACASNWCRESSEEKPLINVIAGLLAATDGLQYLLYTADLYRFSGASSPVSDYSFDFLGRHTVRRCHRVTLLRPAIIQLRSTRPSSSSHPFITSVAQNQFQPDHH